MDDTLHQVENFQGKRNSVITLFIPPDTNYKKDLDSIERAVRAIKHSNKRGQIMKVLRCISDHTEDVKTFNDNGAIICCGYTMSNDQEYYELRPPNKIEKFEYYYDYVFNIQRIREIYHRDVITVQTPEEDTQSRSSLEKHIIDSDNLVVIGDEISSALELRMITELFWASNEIIDNDLISKVRFSRGKIIKLDMSNVLNQEFGQKYGGKLGVLHYPMRFDENY